jgi:hypothetical protein
MWDNRWSTKLAEYSQPPSTRATTHDTLGAAQCAMNLNRHPDLAVPLRAVASER